MKGALYRVGTFMTIGINLNSVTYWATQEPFVDRFHTAGAWIAKNSSGTDISSKLVLDGSGDPVNLNGVSSLAVSIGVDPRSAPPIDQYVLTYDGTAGTVTIANGTIVSQTAGKVVFNYVGGDETPDIYLAFSKLAAADPIGDVHLVRADQQDLYKSGEIFNPAFVAKVAQLGMVRMMDWGNTNDSHAVSWSTRTGMDDGSWSKQTTTDGVPIEAMVQLANQAHVDLWYNVPTKADNSYVTNAMTYIRDHLASDLKVHVEYSNEVWNTDFAANGYAQNKANALWGNGATVSHGANIYYGYRSAQIADIANHVFSGPHADQLVDVLSGQAAGSGPMTYMLQGIAKAGLGSSATLFDDYAVAPYFGSEMGPSVKAVDENTILGWAKSGAAGMDLAFKELEFGGLLHDDSSLAVIHQRLVKSEAAAQSAGLDLVAYEGGISLRDTRWAEADKPAIQDFFDRLLEDPRMGQLYDKMLADFKAIGGTDFLAFNDVGGNNFGVLDSIYDSGSPRFDALVGKATPADGPPAELPAGPTAGADHIVATAQGGLINALGGNDVVIAGAGNDTIDGNSGDDSIVGASSTTDAKGNLIEADYYYGGTGSDTIVGGIGNDHIWGNEPTSTSGDGDGADLLSGGAGSDIVRGNGGNDTLDGGEGNNLLYGEEGDDWLTAGAGRDNLQGGAGNDYLSSRAGNDTLRGGSGNDTLNGGDGDDYVTGDTGVDRMTGGAGKDQFAFGAGQAAFATTGSSAYRLDEITDFAVGSDKLVLGFHPDAILTGSASTTAAAMDWAAQVLKSHPGIADVAAVTVGSDTYIFYDDHGKGGAIDAGIRLDHIAATGLHRTDFL